MQRQLRTLALGLDKEVLGIVLLAAFCLTGLFYFASVATAIGSLREIGLDSAAQALGDWAYSGSDSAWRRRLYWAACSSLFYFVIPLIALGIFSKRPLRDYGLSLRREPAFWRLYAYALLIMVPLVLLMAQTAAFQAIYPFYRPVLQPGWMPRWMLYEAAYLVQFFALEFFFRGLLLHGLRPRLGLQSVAVTMLPYCMLHFGKPLPETLASIVAGLVLGLLSYRSRSIALGFLLHGSVALLMDTAVLYQRGFFAGFGV